MLTTIGKQKVLCPWYFDADIILNQKSKRNLYDRKNNIMFNSKYIEHKTFILIIYRIIIFMVKK